jgi:signal transduction histidine kinase
MTRRQLHFISILRQPRAFSWLGFLVFCAVAVRLFTYLPTNGYQIQTSEYLLRAILLAAILLLLLSDPFLFLRFTAYKYIYFLLQMILIQALGLLPPYQDAWGLLYVMLWVQAFAYFPATWALCLCGFISITFLATLCILLGPAIGLALGFPILAGIVMVVSYEVIYKQVDGSRKESQRLLEEQQQALARQQAYAERVKDLSASLERNRLAQKLQDSVSQTIFGLSLMAQSIRILYNSDPGQVEARLEELQEKTSSTLTQMRALIQQWRPPEGLSATAPPRMPPDDKSGNHPLPSPPDRLTPKTSE